MPPSNIGASTSALMLNESPTLVASAAAPSPRPVNGPRRVQSFYRDARISPDGSCALVLAEDRSLSLFIIPSADGGLGDLDWQPEWTYHPPDSILSFEWFPNASPSNPPFFAFAVGIKDHPVHLLNGFDHQLRATYPIIDHQERFIAPHSMAFSPHGDKLYCGFENAIEVVEISKPGCAGTRIATSPTRASKSGQKGIISSLVFRPDGSGLLAAGSFSGTVGLYNTAVAKPYLVQLIRCTAQGGVTKVAFSHAQDHVLFIASRLASTASAIEVWDLRDLSQPSGGYARDAKTNQRLGFDVAVNGAFVVAGDQHGSVTFFPTATATAGDEGATTSKTFGLCDDAVGAACFVNGPQPSAVLDRVDEPESSSAPTRTLLLTCSGSRSFDSGSDSDSDDSEVETATEAGEGDDHPPTASLQLWQLT